MRHKRLYYGIGVAVIGIIVFIAVSENNDERAAARQGSGGLQEIIASSTLPTSSSIVSPARVKEAATLPQSFSAATSTTVCSAIKLYLIGRVRQAWH
jgi:hypothetical protein